MLFIMCRDYLKKLLAVKMDSTERVLFDVTFPPPFSVLDVDPSLEDGLTPHCSPAQLLFGCL